jgi:peptidoglycan/LPS O-acetylase OafA/YrhL
MTPLDLFLRACFAGFSLILLFVSALAYRRYREVRLGIVAVAFVIFTAVSILTLASGFLGWDVFEMSPYLVALNIGILLCLYFALLKR